MNNSSVVQVECDDQSYYSLKLKEEKNKLSLKMKQML